MSPQLSGISLPGGESLPIARLKPTSHFQLQARLVFLSCCESGISGRTIPPDVFVGLLPSFLQCGAKAAIGALWPVYDDAAMLLSMKFYQLYLDQQGGEIMNPAQALLMAQSWLRSVTVKEIMCAGFFSDEEMGSLMEERFGNVRLRGVQSRKVSGEFQQHSTSTFEAVINEEFCPYQSPVDWAAFVLVGS